MTRRARLAAITAFTLAAAASGPAAWAGDKHPSHGSDHSSKGGQSAKHESSEQSGSSSQGASEGKAKSKDTGAGSEHNPPGNNGTVKIHQVAGDTSPHNVPHVSCDFYITFFGFD